MTETTTDVARYDGPRDMTGRMEYARSLAAASLLPADFRRQPANVLYAIEYGRALDISPIAALTGIHVIEGKPSASSGLISALVRRAGHRLRVRVTGTVAGGDITATCEITRSDDPDFTFSATWDLPRALRSGLIDALTVDGPGQTLIRSRTKKGHPSSWEKFPEAMLKARAITEAAREACEEALSGLHYTAEELGAQVDADEQVVVGEVVDDMPTKATADRTAPAVPTRIPAGDAARVARRAVDCADLQVLRDTWAEAQTRGLLDVDVRAAMTEPELRELFADVVGEQVSLGAVLKSCAEVVDAVSQSLAQVLSAPVPQPGPAPGGSGEQPPDDDVPAPSAPVQAVRRHTEPSQATTEVGRIARDAIACDQMPALTDLLLAAQASQLMNADARPWLTDGVALVLGLEGTAPVPLGAVLHAVRRHLTTGDGASPADAAALTHA